MATPLALEDRFRHSAHHTEHPLAHWLALKTGMHRTVDAPATDTTLPTTWLTLTRKLAAYVRRHGITHAQRLISWPTDAEKTPKLRTTRLQAHTNKRQGSRWPREGQGPMYSNAPKNQPPVQHLNRCHQRHGLGLREQEHRPDGPGDLSQHPKQHRLHPNPSQSAGRAQSSRQKNATPCTSNTLTVRKCKGYSDLC